MTMQVNANDTCAEPGNYKHREALYVSPTCTMAREKLISPGFLLSPETRRAILVARKCYSEFQMTHLFRQREVWPRWPTRYETLAAVWK